MADIDLSGINSDAELEEAIVRRIGELIAERSTAASFMASSDASLRMAAFMEHYADLIHRILLREQRQRELVRNALAADHQPAAGEERERG